MRGYSLLTSPASLSEPEKRARHKALTTRLRKRGVLPFDAESYVKRHFPGANRDLSRSIEAAAAQCWRRNNKRVYPALGEVRERLIRNGFSRDGAEAVFAEMREKGYRPRRQRVMIEGG